jgi:hydroxyacylglutathione hydrolase
MKTERFTSPPFDEHTYLIWGDSSSEAILVDPGGEESRVDAVIQKHGLNLKGIYNTHGHIDHIARVSYFQKKYNLPFFLHPKDAELVANVNQYGSFFGMGEIDIPKLTNDLKEGDIFSVGELKFNVSETPGHTPGGCVFYCESQKLVIVGDLLFQGSVGRTDLPGGDFKQLESSIREKIYSLPEDTIVWSGHGEATTVGQEKNHNPFVKAV